MFSSKLLFVVKQFTFSFQKFTSLYSFESSNSNILTKAARSKAIQLNFIIDIKPYFMGQNI